VKDRRSSQFPAMLVILSAKQNMFISSPLCMEKRYFKQEFIDIGIIYSIQQNVGSALISNSNIPSFSCEQHFHTSHSPF
jgi:hypothetical protein